MIYHPSEHAVLHITAKMHQANNRAKYLRHEFKNTPEDRLRKHLSEAGGFRWLTVSDPYMAAAAMPLFLAGEIDLRIDGDRTVCARIAQGVGKDGLMLP